jgi:pimeloyl-ACP methyl ester carboxylesterase
MTETVQAPDGRRLAVEQSGDLQGKPVFLLHGMPGSRLGPHPRGAILYRLGIRLISFDRPGYGYSDRLADRSVADAAIDVAAIAEAYELERFAVVGRSGGGPHALACAALLPGRTTRVAALVSLAPPDARELNWFDGMAKGNVIQFIAAVTAGYAQICSRLATAANEIRANPAKLMTDLQSDIAPCDRPIITDVGIRARLLSSYSEAFRLSANGWIDDILALSAPWNFDLRQVSVPVLLWHGEEDKFSPVSHTRWLARNIRTTTTVIEPGAAHFAALNALPEILRWSVGDDTI